jgi:hypothetical protein
MTVPPSHRATPGHRPSSPSVSVVVPSGDPDKLPPLLAALPPVHEVIVVVGPGADITRPLPRAARMIRQTRAGVGNALACGVDVSTGDVVVTLPGDGSCDPAELPRLVNALRDGADVVHGSRHLARRPGPVDLVVLWFLRVLFDCRPTDPGHGFRAFWRDRADRLGLPRVSGLDPVRGDGPEIEPLLAVRTAAAGLNGAEVSTTVYPRTGGTALFSSLGALVAEYRDRRRAGRDTAPDSILVMTGSARAPMVNTPHTTARHTAARQTPARGAIWPAPNEPGFNERRRGERRDTERGRGSGSRDRRRGDMPFAGRGWGKPQIDATVVSGAATGDHPTRRRWRDSRLDQNSRGATGRPDLRVINGEGTGPATRRNNHLRSV